MTQFLCLGGPGYRLRLLGAGPLFRDALSYVEQTYIFI